MADELVFTLSIKDNASAQIDAFTRKIDGIGQQAQKEFGAFRENFNRAFGDLGKPINDINSMKTALMGLAGTGAAMAVKELSKFTADSVKNFAAYEQTLAGVQRTVGMTDEQITQLGESLRTLAMTDLKGQVTADQLAAIAEAAGQMGITAEEDIMSFAKAVAQVSVATGQDMENTALSFGRIADLFKESLGADAYQKIGNIGSAFDALADSSSASVEGILAYTNRLAGTATALGLTVDQTAAIGATLESMGVPAERGSTAISKVFLQLKKDSGSFADALDLDATKLKTALETKPVEGVNMVIDAMAKMNKERPTEFLTSMEDLLGKGSGVTEVVLKLSEGSASLATNMGAAAKAMDEGTRAGESFATAAKTQEGSWAAIKTAVDDLQKSVGQQLQPTLTTLGTWLQTASTWWANAFRAENINQFFDDIVAGWGILKTEADNFGKAWNDVMSGLKKEWDTFVKAITDSVQAVKKVVEDVKGIIKDAMPGGGKGTVAVSGFEKGAVESLENIKVANLALIKSNQELKQEYFSVKTAFDAAYANGGKPTQDLVEATQRLKVAMAAAGGETTGLNSLLVQLNDSIAGTENELEGKSLTPALHRYIDAAIASGTATGGLTQEMQASMQSVLEADKAYQALEKDLNQNQRAVLDVEKSMQVLKQTSVNASDFEKKRIAEELKGLQVKRSELMIEKKEIQSKMDLTREEIDLGKDVIKVFEDQQKAAEDMAKARNAAEKELQENSKRTADIRQQQMQEEMKAANDLYREQQKQAADSIKWIGQIDEATKKKLFAEKDAVKVLQAQGVELSDLQQQEVRRMQQAYKTDAAYEAQAKTLESQLSPMNALIAAGDKVSGGLSVLGGGVGKIGDLLGFDTSKITGVFDKMQGFAEMPKIFAEMKAGLKDTFDGIKDAFSSLKDLDFKNLFSGEGEGGGISGLISSLSGIGSVAGIIMAAWGPLKDFFKGLFEEHKSKGQEAADTWQKFVKGNVEGGAAMAKAMEQARSNMDFKDQFASLTDSTYQLWNAFANTPIDGVNTGLQLLEQTMTEAGVPTEKLGQVAIQTFAGMQDSGMGAAEMSKTLADMLGLTQEQADALSSALTGTAGSADDYASSVQNATSAAQSSVSANQSLASSTSGISSGYANAADAVRAFAQAQAQAQVLQSMGIQTAAGGGIIQSGLAIVNERGSEIARFPGGSMALMTARGATLSAFPVGTEIIPHSRSMQMMRDYPNIPRMATGGTVKATTTAPVVNNYYTVNLTASVIDRNTARMIDAELQKLSKQRTGV